MPCRAAALRRLAPPRLLPSRAISSPWRRNQNQKVNPGRVDQPGSGCSDAEPDATGANPAAGTWRITFTTPRGEQQAELVLGASAGGWAGTYNGDPVSDLAVDGAMVAFAARLREPFPTNVRWSGTIDGEVIRGEAKASFNPLPFTATRGAVRRTTAPLRAALTGGVP